MVARVTLAEIDTVRLSVAAGVERFKELVLPELCGEPGYRGVYVLSTPEGKALVITFWNSEEEAEAGLASGFYAQQVEKFVTFFNAAPGREAYEVVLAEPPAPQAGADGSRAAPVFEPPRPSPG